MSAASEEEIEAMESYGAGYPEEKAAGGRHGQAKDASPSTSVRSYNAPMADGWTREDAPQWPMAAPERMQNPVLGPPPLPMYNKPVGPCFQCGMIGHLKQQCPKLVRPRYPSQSSNIDKLPHTVCIDNEVGDALNNVCEARAGGSCCCA